MSNRLPPSSQLLKMSPLAQVLGRKPPSLPIIKAPPLENLEVRVPKADDITEGDLFQRFHEKLRAISEKRNRVTNESLALGDDVQLNLLGYSGGKLLPFSARFGLWMEAAPQQELPGLMEAIVQEARVGQSCQLSFTLPPTYPVEAFRAKPVRFIVDVLAARAVSAPEPESASTLSRMGLGSTLDEVMLRLRAELEKERDAMRWVEAENLVLDALLRRANIEVPKSLVDDEIRLRWANIEGKSLVEKGFDVDEQNEALKAWLDDGPTRAECKRRLGIGLVLRAIVDRDKLSLSKEKIEELLFGYAKPFGLGAESVKSALSHSKEETQKLVELAWHLFAVEHVLKAAKVTFENE